MQGVGLAGLPMLGCRVAQSTAQMLCIADLSASQPVLLCASPVDSLTGQKRRAEQVDNERNYC